MNKTTLIFFLLAIVCYLFAFTEVAIGLGFFGILFELFMYISIFEDQRTRKRKKTKPNTKEYRSDIK